MPEPDKLALEIYVQPGESHLVSQPTVLRTVLGSCVGITFLIPRLGFGALCHPMLPRCPDEGWVSMAVASGRRYVDFAIRDMARQLDSLGATRSEAQVKLFGGGDVLTVVNGSSRPTVGKLNGEAAFKVLEDEGFKIAACRLGGHTGVHIQFSTATGEVLVRKLDATSAHSGSRSHNKVHRYAPPR
jgi:chemotaxis protein CheD